MTQFQYQLDSGILREYDVRGIVGKTLFPKDAHAVGRAFGHVIARAGGKFAGICHDGRHSSPEFTDAVIKGLMENGLQVENYGLAPTALAYYALHERKLDGVLVVTGSHNPPDYNGIKMALKSGPVYGDAIREFGDLAAAGLESREGGKVETVDINEAYLNRLAADYKDFGKKPMKIAWDAGNGVVGALLKRFVDKIPGEHILLFDKVDGDFPNHHPDPAVEKNLADLKRAVADNQCDIGFAFDGDGDRVGAIDKNGKVIWGDQMIALYAREILDRDPGATVIIDVKCSKTVSDLIESYGGKVIMWKTGHSLVKEKMLQTKAAMGGELSGHIFFKDGFYGHDDGMYGAIRLLNVINKYGALDELQNLFPTVYNTPEIRFEVPEEDKFPIMTRAKMYVDNINHPDVKILDIDGIRVNSKTGWWLLRASNTQNVLVARAEAVDETELHNLVDSLKETLHAAGCVYPEPLY